MGITYFCAATIFLNINPLTLKLNSYKWRDKIGVLGVCQFSLNAYTFGMSEPNIYHLFSGLTHHNEPDVDIITWSNRETPKNTWLYLAFIGALVVTIPLALFLTLLLFNDLYSQVGLSLSTGELLFSGFMVVASWVAVVAISHYLIRLSWTESIKISKGELSLHYSGLFSPKAKRFTSNQIWRLSFERVGNERDRETRFTLNFFDLDDKRYTLAYWIRDDENYQLFLLLSKIFEARGWSVQNKSNYRPNRIGSRS